MDETLLLGTNWFNKSRAKLDFENNTLNIRYLGKKATTNATHTTNFYPILEEVDENEEDQ